MKKSTKIIAVILGSAAGLATGAIAVKSLNRKKGEKVIDGDALPKPDNAEYDAQIEAAKDLSANQPKEEE